MATPIQGKRSPKQQQQQQQGRQLLRLVVACVIASQRQHEQRTVSSFVAPSRSGVANRQKFLMWRLPVLEASFFFIFDGGLRGKELRRYQTLASHFSECSSKFWMILFTSQPIFSTRYEVKNNIVGRDFLLKQDMFYITSMYFQESVSHKS